MGAWYPFHYDTIIVSQKNIFVNQKSIPNDVFIFYFKYLTFKRKYGILIKSCEVYLPSRQ